MMTLSSSPAVPRSPRSNIAVDIYRRLASEYPRLRLVLVPRHPERFDAVAKLLDSANITWCRRSQLTTRPSPLAPRPSLLAPILLVDTVGELAAWWGTATIALVGGSFGPRGGQNMIEPAAYAAAVSFGPNTRNFRDVVASLLAANAAVVVHDADELESFVRRSLDEPAWAAAFGVRAQAFVQTQLGATARTVRLVESLLPAATARRSAA